MALRYTLCTSIWKNFLDITGFFRLFPIIPYGHTAATVMLQNGTDIRTLSAMLGHYDAGFTLRTYTHTTTKQQEQAAERMGALLAGKL